MGHVQTKLLNARAPRVLYKYCALSEWTRSIFERNEIYFQSPDCFNDPFDSKMSTTYEGTEESRVSCVMDLLRKGIMKGLKKNKEEEDLHREALDFVKRGQDISLALRTLEQAGERMRRQIGIFCMTSKRDNILMWSHYADHHKGFCLGFKTGNPFFARAAPVGYDQDRLCINWLAYPGRDKVAEALRTKAKDWEYEEEWRVIDHRRGPGIQMYPPDALGEVILGCRVVPDDRVRIIQWCRARDPRPALYAAQEKHREFGLDIVPLSY